MFALTPTVRRHKCLESEVLIFLASLEKFPTDLRGLLKSSALSKMTGLFSYMSLFGDSCRNARVGDSAAIIAVFWKCLVLHFKEDFCTCGEKCKDILFVS